MFKTRRQISQGLAILNPSPHYLLKARNLNYYHWGLSCITPTPCETCVQMQCAKKVVSDSQG